MNGSTRVEVVIEILRAALDARMGLVVGGLGRLLREGGASGSAGPRPRRVTLTDREGEVLRLLARGYKAATIGRMAGCSERTVHRHLSNIYVKLGVRDRLSAINRANELGLLTEDQVLLA